MHIPISAGDIVEGRITGITKFGAFVEYEDGTKGFAHISQISNDYTEKAEDVLEVNDVVKYKVMSTEDSKTSFSVKEYLPREEHKEKFSEETFSDESRNSNKESSPESALDDLLSKFIKESSERLDFIRQRGDKEFSKKKKYN